MRGGPAWVRVAKAVYTVQALKAHHKARDKAKKLHWAVARMRLRLNKLERKAAQLREKMNRVEERANRLDGEAAEAPRSDRPVARSPPGH